MIPAPLSVQSDGGESAVPGAGHIWEQAGLVIRLTGFIKILEDTAALCGGKETWQHEEKRKGRKHRKGTGAP